MMEPIAKVSSEVLEDPVLLLGKWGLVLWFQLEAVPENRLENDENTVRNSSIPETSEPRPSTEGPVLAEEF